MCWCSTKKPKAKIAWLPKKVYKVVSYIMNSPIRGFHYNINEKNPKEKICVESYLNAEIPTYIINKGYHSYSNKVKIKKLKGINEDITVIDGLKNGNLMVLQEYWKIYEAYIPFGAKYYENENGEIVSENLVITNKVIQNGKI